MDFILHFCFLVTQENVVFSLQKLYKNGEIYVAIFIDMRMAQKNQKMWEQRPTTAGKSSGKCVAWCSAKDPRFQTSSHNVKGKNIKRKVPTFSS
jgi:hypothetical protein